MVKYISDKRRERIPERQAVVAQALTRDKDCILRKIVRCQCRRLDPDEIIPRSSWTEGIYVLDNIQMLGDRCHHVKHHVEVKSSMIVGLYGFERMSRYEMTVEERIEHFGVFTGYVNEVLAEKFIEERLKEGIE